MTEYKLDKRRVIFNADYKPSIDFFQKQYDILKELNKDFPNYHVSALDFVVEDKENHFSEHFTNKKCVFEFDDANSKMPDISSKIVQGLNAYNKHIQVESYMRLGLRVFVFVPMKEIKINELADIFWSKLYAKNDFVSEKVDDLAYIIYFSKDDLSYHLRSGPMPKEQITTFIDFGDPQKRFKAQEIFDKYMEEYPETSIFIDVDCYRKAVPFSEKDDFLKKAMDSCNQIASKLSKHLLG